MIGGARVYWVQSGMGSGGTSGSQATVTEAIEALHPEFVIAVGIAFGVDESKQSIGEILVSQQLQPYELQRVGSEQILRADKPSAPVRIYDRFRSAALDWTEADVDFGVLLSGEKLVDDVDYRGSLISLSPEAIGGEMEGAGVYAAAARAKVDWIVIKAICDWADGHKALDKAARQEKAARNAARFVLHAINQGGFAPGRGR